MWFFSKLSDQIVLVFPPWDHHEIFFEVEMKELTHCYVKPFDSIWIDTFSWVFGLFVKPMGDIGACSLDDWLYLWFLSILLNEPGKVVDLTEERKPDVVGMRVSLEFGKIVESSFVVRFRNLFCELFFAHKFQFLKIRICNLNQTYRYWNFISFFDLSFFHSIKINLKCHTKTIDHQRASLSS